VCDGTSPATSNVNKRAAATICPRPSPPSVGAEKRLAPPSRPPRLHTATSMVPTTVGENVCNNSKKRKKSCFFGFWKKKRKKTLKKRTYSLTGHLIYFYYYFYYLRWRMPPPPFHAPVLRPTSLAQCTRPQGWGS